MKGKIAVENNLTPVKDYLASKGYNVECVDLNKRQPSINLQSYDAIVVTGQNTDFLGYEDTRTSAMVVNADGLTPEDVEKRLNSK